MGPNECKYCGCREIRTETDSAIHFRCFSSYWHDGDEWNISNNCAAVCAVQFVELRERVQRAVEVLEGARRICVVISDENDDPLDSEHDGVIYIEAAEADQAAAILRGNSPETPDSSPITADDLAVAEDRIRRSIDALKAATRYRVTPQTRRTIEWEQTVDGIVADSAAVDEALAILEGERDETT